MIIEQYADIFGKMALIHHKMNGEYDLVICTKDKILKEKNYKTIRGVHIALSKSGIWWHIQTTNYSNTQYIKENSLTDCALSQKQLLNSLYGKRNKK